MEAKLFNMLVYGFSKTFNRSKGQVMEMFTMCGYDLFKYVALEEAINNNFLYYAPGDIEEVERILSMSKPAKTYYTFDEWRVTIDPTNRWVLYFHSESGKTYPICVPPTSGDRIDIIENTRGNEWRYRYNCKSHEFHGVEIHIVNGRITAPVFTNS